MVLLRRVHAVLIRIVRSGSEVAPRDMVVGSCSIRAKRGGELTGPNPTDRGMAGGEYHVVVSTDGLPPVAVPLGRQRQGHVLFLRLAAIPLT